MEHLVPQHLNHLARTDAARVVKLLCLAAGSPSADREHEGEHRYRINRHQAQRCQRTLVFSFSAEPECDVTLK